MRLGGLVSTSAKHERAVYLFPVHKHDQRHAVTLVKRLGYGSDT